MDLFDVYSLFDIVPVKAEGCYLWDDKGNKYLDLYGGHAVISIGHSHPHYIERISSQLKKIGFYSNSVKNPLQKEFANKLGRVSGLDDYSLFLCNSGAEANENAFKLASFHTGRNKIVAFEKAFHGRTSAAVAATDNKKIVAPVNAGHEVEFVAFNDIVKTEEVLSKKDVAAVIIEGIQGVGGVNIPDDDFLKSLKTICRKYGTLLILDEIQSGYGRSGKFFAFQYSGTEPDMVTVAKGMGNGFPMGGVLISPDIKPQKGMLGTTFGGSYLACAAGLAVLEVMENENLVENAKQTGAYLMKKLKNSISYKELKGRGLMIGVEFSEKISDLRFQLLNEKRIFTGISGTNTLRLLPPLTLSEEQSDCFTDNLCALLNSS
ncbi:MAG: aspartate aminotransferase family protein [Chlorobi bacterium]|nr:aspartate aminotransferase family protein [Chlorobiota bacterium]